MIGVVKVQEFRLIFLIWEVHRQGDAVVFRQIGDDPVHETQVLPFLRRLLQFLGCKSIGILISDDFHIEIPPFFSQYMKKPSLSSKGLVCPSPWYAKGGQNIRG
jgi:hypothetical protein